ncbi:MAG: tetratricopeptide repeat protein [Pseudomonadota bacterium]|nr:tetratricopeptide repeat protein [Pseudomonadota bacterium]
MPPVVISFGSGLAAAAVALTLAFASPVLAAPPPKSAPQPPGDATTRALEPLLIAEFDLQAGRLEEAAGGYLDAAKAARDITLAQRATQVALLARDDTRTAQALGLWRELGGAGDPFEAAQAMLALRRNDESGARKHLAALLQSPREGWRQAVGVLMTGAADQPQAARVLEALLDEQRIPQNLQAWLAFGGLAQRLERPELAERIVAEVVERFPGEPRVALLRASQLREAGRLDQAREVLETVAAEASGDDGLRLSVAAEYDALGDFAAAARVLAQGPQDDQSYAMRASLLARDEDKASLLALYRELSRDAAKPDPQRRLLLGQMAEFLDHFEEALTWYRGVPGGPQRWLAQLRSANVLFELKRAGEAFKLLADLQADAEAPEGARRDAYVLEADLHQKAGQDAAELDAFARGLAAFPDSAELLYARALTWERRDEIARAEADFRQILVAEPDSVAALNALGYTLADRTTRYREALELINRARAAEPGNAAIIDSYGWVLYRLGRNEEALTELRRAFALQRDAEIAAHLGEVLWVLGRRQEAQKYFAEARKLDPDNRALKRALDKAGMPVGGEQ